LTTISPENPGAGFGKRSRSKGLFPLLLTVFLSFLLFFGLALSFLPDFAQILSPYDLSHFYELQGEEERLFGELRLLKGDYMDALFACHIPEEEIGGPESLKDHRTLSGILDSEGEDPPAEEEALEEKSPQNYRVAVADPPPRSNDKPVDSISLPSLKPDGKKASGSALVVPQGATDLSFLEGCWRSASNLVNDKAMPIIYTYCFNKTGGATVYIKEEDKSGKGSGDDCRGSATATFSGSLLQIKDDGPVCAANNKSYFVTIIDCRVDALGFAKCRGKSQSPRFEPFSTTFYYLGSSRGD
jgi:hypothetical protein